ncbi:hypothetical protein KIW84_062572 [Lathyrus oleraceus]|uniref:Reverse transcriptase zinc-binding domain-containing protein n=1 Tax=Pisum sativum TaxID=3888 RepID=A0A9D4W7M2_PEA|nr:hypothetical protein KIW84_062572 [Pisum sativum]
MLSGRNLLLPRNRKKDNLWIKWIHIFYFKGNEVHNVQLTHNASWIIKNVLKQQDIVSTMQEWNLMKDHFNMKKVYDQIRGDVPDVNWKCLLQKSLARPRAIFIFWLLCHNMMPTKARLKRFGMVDGDKCVLCPEVETTDQLFFCYPTLTEWWSHALAWLKVDHNPQGWD